jgi:hypothetical protein
MSVATQVRDMDSAYMIPSTSKARGPSRKLDTSGSSTAYPYAATRPMFEYVAACGPMVWVTATRSIESRTLESAGKVGFSSPVLITRAKICENPTPTPMRTPSATGSMMKRWLSGGPAGAGASAPRATAGGRTNGPTRVQAKRARLM